MNKNRVIIISIVTSILITTVSQCTHIKENSLWDLFDEIQRKFFPQTIFNELVIKDPEKLHRRVQRDVDKAIQEYEQWEASQPPRMTNQIILKHIRSKWIHKSIVEDAIYYECSPDDSKAQSLLGGPMGIRGVWVDSDPKCH